MTPPHSRLTPALSPHGRLTLVASDDAPELAPELAQRLTTAFERGSGAGLLQLSGAEIGQPLPPAFSYWRELGSRYVTALCTRPGADTKHSPVPPPDIADLEILATRRARDARRRIRQCAPARRALA